MGGDCQHSRIYYLILDKLDNQDNPIGMFAYAVYKRQKMAERNRLEKELKRPPNNEDFAPFVDGAALRIDDFLRLAEIELSEFQDALVGEHLEELSSQYDEKYKEEIRKFQPQKQPSWAKQMLYGVGGNFATAVISFIIFVFCVILLEGAPSLATLMIKMLTRFTQ